MAEDDGCEKLVCHKEIKGELTKNTYNDWVVRHTGTKTSTQLQDPNEQEIIMKMLA